MPSTKPDMESIYIEVPSEMKRSLEALVVEYKRRRDTSPRSLSGVVRLACEQLLQRDLPGYVSPSEKEADQDSGA
jgi:hypothetical protein